MITRAPRLVRAVRVGRLALIRRSSVIAVPSSGTLRSARSRTTRPATSRSSTRFISAGVPFRTGLPGCGYGGQRSSEPPADERGEVDQPARVAPLVVIPADHLDLVAEGHGETGVERAGVRGADDVGGHDRVAGVVQVALERAVGRRPV